MVVQKWNMVSDLFTFKAKLELVKLSSTETNLDNSEGSLTMLVL